MGSRVRLDDVQHGPHGSVIDVIVHDHARTVTLPGLGVEVVRRAVDQLESALREGIELDAAIAALVISDVPGRTFRLRARDGALLLDDTAAVSPEDVRASLRVLADLGRSGLRTIAVVGPLAVTERNRLDEHDALGRIVVRLDVRQLVVVGHDARHLHMAASLEGSWDGESVLMDDARSAYDFVRATSGPDAVILISGGAGVDLPDLVERLSGARS